LFHESIHKSGKYSEKKGRKKHFVFNRPVNIKVAPLKHKGLNKDIFFTLYEWKMEKILTKNKVESC
jgi:hypothetical protein